jgi:hypothetical protein
VHEIEVSVRHRIRGRLLDGLAVPAGRREERLNGEVEE